MNIVLVGPPGAGKGTQAAILEARTVLTHVASGDLLRQHIQHKTPLGELAKAYIDRGELVPSDVVINMILERISQPDCMHGVIFDGFPRTIDQAIALSDILEEHGHTIDAVIFLNASQEVLLKRIAGRQTCPECQLSYNIYYAPPHQAGFCDQCGNTLHMRTDDTIETAARRLEVYFAQTMPLIAHYQELDLLFELDGVGETDAITEQLLGIIDSIGNRERVVGYVPMSHSKNRAKNIIAA